MGNLLLCGHHTKQTVVKPYYEIKFRIKKTVKIFTKKKKKKLVLSFPYFLALFLVCFQFVTFVRPDTNNITSEPDVKGMKQKMIVLRTKKKKASFLQINHPSAGRNQ